MRRTFPGMAILALAASCGLAVGRAGAQAPPRPTQPASTRAAGGELPDIVGLRPGLSFQEAYNSLKAHNRVAKVAVLWSRDPDFGPDSIPYTMVQAEEGAMSAELIEAYVTLPPGKPVVWQLVRTLRFPQDKLPLIKNLVATLREKYGPESHVIQSTTPTLNWYFDEHGKPVTETGGLNFAHCAVFGENRAITDPGTAAVSGPQYLLKQPVRKTGTSQDLCHSLVIVRATFGMWPSDPVLALTLTVRIMDFPLEVRAREATVEYLAKGAAAQREKELEKANQQAKPKL